MKLFPNKNFVVELKVDRAATLNELKRNTKLTDTLVSEYTDKEFIGQVDDCGFKIISSEIGRGAVCVFIGELQDSFGTVEIRIHNAFKVMFSILMLMPIVGFGIAVLTNGIENSFGIIIPMIMGVLFVRYVFMELSFRFISKTGMNKLTKIIGIKTTE
jgi:hypothetical protein